MEDGELLNSIQSKIQRILDRRFASDSWQKRRIDTFHDRINFSCPLCGDSRSNPRKKRGNLYLDGLHYHCFNCGEHMGVRKLLRDFGESLSMDETLAVREIQQSAKHFERRNASNQSSMLYSVIDELAVPKKVFFERTGAVTPSSYTRCSRYLESRGIGREKWGCFAFRPDSTELFILNLTRSGRVIGYQIRQLDMKSGRPRYLTRNMTRMYADLFGVPSAAIIDRMLRARELGGKYIDEEDGIENVVANIDKISGIFNIMNIDMDRTITVVEGPIDSISVDNCVALQGAKKMNDYFDSIDNVRYVFDRDSAGKQEAIKKLRKHKSVFLWEMYVKRLGIKGKVKDINDLERNGCLDRAVMEECFSDDELDVVMI